MTTLGREYLDRFHPKSVIFRLQDVYPKDIKIPEHVFATAFDRATVGQSFIGENGVVSVAQSNHIVPRILVKTVVEVYGTMNPTIPKGWKRAEKDWFRVSTPDDYYLSAIKSGCVLKVIGCPAGPRIIVVAGPRIIVVKDEPKKKIIIAGTFYQPVTTAVDIYGADELTIPDGHKLILGRWGYEFRKPVIGDTYLNINLVAQVATINLEGGPRLILKPV